MNMTTETAPAKLNLALDILGRRTDGYHELRMVMQSVALCDTVTVRETGQGFALRTGGDFLVPGKKTLEQRAAEAFFAHLGRPMPGLEVTLEKRIPAYAGMGGGSADVAALLRGLRRLYCPELPLGQLEEIGLTVGSDVPFCVRGGTALAEGRGERLAALPPLPRCCILVCKPDFDLPTPALFGRVRAEALTDRPDLAAMAAALARGDLPGVAGRLGNVFEQVLTVEERREVASVKEAMVRCGALGAAMTGSGPTVFGLFAGEPMAAQAAEALTGRYAQVFLTGPAGPVV